MFKKFFLAASLFLGLELLSVPLYADLELATVQVDVEVRFLTVQDNFLRDVGVDLRSLGNGEGATALAKKNDNEVWFYTLNAADHQVYRVPVLINPQIEVVLSALEKFDALKILPTPKIQTATNLTSTLLITPEIKFMEAKTVDSDGLSKGKDFRISPISTSFLTGGISSDGRVSVISEQVGAAENSRIILQLLTGKSRRKPGELQILITPHIVGSADISDPLGDDLRTTASTRFLIYRAFKTVGADIHSALFLQVLDGENGTPIGAPKVLRPFRKTNQVLAEFFQSVAVDPDGKYVLFSGFKGSCGKEILYKLNLNSNGNPSGRAKVVVGCSKVKNSSVGVNGIDILDLD